MISYFNPFFDDGIVYSCDNIRLSLEFLSTDSCEHFLSWLSQFEYAYYRSSKPFSYKHLFVFGCKGLSFSIGCCLNGSSSSDDLKGFLDINPNKILGDIAFQGGFVRCEDSVPFDGDSDRLFLYTMKQQLKDVFYQIERKLHQVCLEVSIRRFDFAVDVPFPRNEVQLIKDNRMYSQFYRSPLDFTEYLGQPDNHGRVKVYNKQLEAELEYPLTRIEITLNSMDSVEFQKRWPKVYVKEIIDFDEPVLVKLLRRLPADEMNIYLHQVSKNTLKKYRAMIFEKPFQVPDSVFRSVCSMISEFEMLRDVNSSSSGCDAGGGAA